MKLTDEFVAIMSYLTLLNEMSFNDIDTGEFPINDLEVDFLDSIVAEINEYINDDYQAERFVNYIKSNIKTLFPIVFEQYKNEIEEHNLPLNQLLN